VLVHEEIPVLHGIEASLINNFLETHVPETDIELIKIIEWRPSLNYYKDSYVKLLSHVVEFLKRTDAGNRTTAAFGKRWVRNFFKNLENIDKTLLYRQTTLPVIITGSGPSLEKAMPIIKKIQKNCLIIASSSSVMALSYNNIKADIIISTDGGNWALHHTYAAYRYQKNTNLAVNLCAALPSQYRHSPLLVINDGSLWQNIILHKLSIPSVIIPQRGTVTATAAELAGILSNANIYLAGMDLSVNDIKTHVKPYGFDNLFFSRASRLFPVYNELFTRFTLLKQGASLDIYAAWFKNNKKSLSNKIFSLDFPGSGESNIFKNASPFDLSGTKKDDTFFKIENINKDSSLLQQTGLKTLIDALKEKQYGEDLKKELNALLFPGEKTVTAEALENALKEAANKKGSYE